MNQGSKYIKFYASRNQLLMKKILIVSFRPLPFHESAVAWLISRADQSPINRNGIEWLLVSCENSANIDRFGGGIFGIQNLKIESYSRENISVY